jgi:hypothetical protein
MPAAATLRPLHCGTPPANLFRRDFFGCCAVLRKNRVLGDELRDAQNVTDVLGKYIISDKPMTEKEWARELRRSM